MNTDLGSPKFHVPTQKQFYKICSLTDQKKSQIEASLKYTNRYIREVATARWEKLFYMLLWLFEWKLPHRFICLNGCSTVGGTFKEGLGGMSLGVVFEISKAHTIHLSFLSLSLPASLSTSCLCIRFSSQILLTGMPAWCPASHHNDHELFLWNYKQGPKLNASFYKLPWTWCFVIAAQE